MATTTFFAVPLRRFVDDGQWDAEDLAGRLGIVAHAAFLSAGFEPHGAAPLSGSGHLLKHVDEIGPSAPRLSRRYTAPQLARDHGADVAVLELRAQGNSDVALQTYLRRRHGQRWGGLSLHAVLDEAHLAPILSGVDSASRGLATGAAGSWLWKPLADWLCRAFFLEVCRWNGLPVTEFTSLPDDAKVEILKRLADGKDLAMVECSSRRLRRLVAERDGELWKHMHHNLDRLLLEEIDPPPPPVSWKERYVDAQRLPNRSRRPWASHSHRPPFDSAAFTTGPEAAELPHASMRRQQSWFLHRVRDPAPPPATRVPDHSSSYIIEPIVPMRFSGAPFRVRHPPPPPPLARVLEVVAARNKKDANQRRKVPRKHYNQKRHGAGAVYSPSSRYRWNHR